MKNSSARQSWKGKLSAGSFSIAPAKSYYRDGIEWIDQAGRHAEIYIFAWHPVSDDTADHRDPARWQFFVVGTCELPDQRSVSRAAIERRWKSVGYTELGKTVSAVADTIGVPHASLTVRSN